MWSYRVPPDIAVTVQARTRPSLLAHVLGAEMEDARNVALALDLTQRQEAASEERESRTVPARGVYKAIPWSCRVARREPEGWTLGFKSLLLREYLAFHIALLPALRRLLLDRGIALITGAAFEQDGVATVLTGPTGRGKTTLLLGALERGARLLGDEYVGLSERAQATPVVRALAFRKATMALAPRMLQRLGSERRLALHAASLAASLTRRRLEPLVHVAPSELGVAVTEAPTRVQRLFWLEPPTTGDGQVRCEPMEPAEVVQQLSIAQSTHDLAYGDLGVLLDGLAGCAEGAYVSRWRTTLLRGLEDVSSYRLALPAGPISSQVLERVLGSTSAAA